jgi:tetratricopeptide (TPR) repeat protein
MKGVQTTLSKVIEAQPNNPIGYYQLGQYYLTVKKFDEAIREFEIALKKSTDPYQVLTAIVSANLAQGKPERAINRLNDILKESANHPFAHELLAEVYITKKQYPEAEKELFEAIKNSPKWNIPYRNLANLYLVRGEFPAAEKTYQQGLQAIPDDPQLLLHLAEAHERTRDYGKAISMYERVLQKNPDVDVATNNLVSLLTDQRGDAASLKRARELAARFESSSQPVFMDTLGWVYYKSGELDKAVTLLKKVVEKAPSVAIFQYHLGMAYHKAGDDKSAKTHLSKAMEANSDFPGKDEARATLKQIP